MSQPWRLIVFKTSLALVAVLGALGYQFVAVMGGDVTGNELVVIARKKK